MASSVKFFQHEIQLSAAKRGCRLITNEILQVIRNDLEKIKTGICHVFLVHTSASLLINESYDADVQHDMETFLNKIVPEGARAPWLHTDEGYDDMPAHVKCAMFGVDLNIPISNGALRMGTWQGIWLCEHRNRASPRTVIVTLQGNSKT